MFMVKDESDNTAKLLKVKVKTTMRGFRWFFIIAALIYLPNLIQAAFSVVHGDYQGFNAYSAQDYSISLFPCLVFAIFFLAALYYRQINDCLSVFPQTNNSRFISSLMLNYFFAFALGATILIMHLCGYAIHKLISHVKDDVFLVLNFDIGFMIIGFLTFLMYGFMIVALSGLIGVIMRKWRWYAAAVFVSAFVLMMTDLELVIENVSWVLTFITEEPVPALFFLKGFFIWLIITALSLVINHRTVYYKSHVKLSTAGIVAVCVIAVTAAVIVPAFAFFSNNGSSGEIRVTTTAIPGWRAAEDLSETTRIDVSHLPKGSKINIESTEVFFPDRSDASYASRFPVHARGEEALDDLQGDTLVLRYNPSFWEMNGYDMTGYFHPTLTAGLDGHTLHITYTIDGAYVVFLPIWGFAKQFDCYADKGLLLEYPWGSSEGGGSGGSLEISVE